MRPIYQTCSCVRWYICVCLCVRDRRRNMLSWRWIGLPSHGPLCLTKCYQVGIQIGHLLFDHKFHHFYAAVRNFVRFEMQQPKSGQQAVKSALFLTNLLVSTAAFLLASLQHVSHHICSYNFTIDAFFVDTYYISACKLTVHINPAESVYIMLICDRCRLKVNLHVWKWSFESRICAWLILINWCPDDRC